MSTVSIIILPFAILATLMALSDAIRFAAVLSHPYGVVLKSFYFQVFLEIGIITAFIVSLQ